MADGGGLAGGQSYVERRPVAALAGLAAAAWIQQIAPDAQPYRQRNIPNGGVELLCVLGAEPRIVGPHTRPREAALAPGTTIVGVRFLPGAASPALGLPAAELADLDVGADALWGRRASALGEGIAGAASPEAALAALQHHLAGRLGDAGGPDPVISQAVRLLMPWGAGDVGSITQALYISERQLRRRCQAAVGMPPKTLQRILRFQGFLALVQHALAQGRRPTDDGLAQYAADVGYADQSHLSRECVRLTGVSPRTFLADTEHSCACGHDHAASFAPLLRSRPA